MPNHRPQRFYSNSILDLIGNTPLIRLTRVTRGLQPRVEVYAKAEWFNPGGSVKDRPALWMIEDGEKTGQLTRDKVILDATSGNTGIAYALVGAVKGYQVELVLPANATLERKKILRAYGARAVYSNPLEGSDGAQRLARQRYEAAPERYFMPNQYANAANPLAHYETTGPEIFAQTGGRVTHFVAGIGTSGTLMGTGRRLREYNPGIQVIAVEPDASLHGLEGLKHMPSSIRPLIYDETFPDRIIPVKTETAYELAEQLSQEEGLLVGHSAGAALVGALAVARDLQEGVVVAIFPDSGDRYLSTVTLPGERPMGEAER
ncbi:MAG: pyridoxal-phosphate dependent enzyme [Deltaproteobacteria bacterium]|nr:pyridoxal-phosphate dependent enzyme [Deltaproteobacteria bacterium]